MGRSCDTNLELLPTPHPRVCWVEGKERGCRDAEGKGAGDDAEGKGVMTLRERG